jgi:hypothetical protein
MIQDVQIIKYFKQTYLQTFILRIAARVVYKDDILTRIYPIFVSCRLENMLSLCNNLA